MKTTKKAKKRKPKRDMLELAGQALIVAVILLVVYLIVQHLFFTPAPPYTIPTLTEGANKDYGQLHSVDVVLHDGTQLRCLILGEGSSAQSISCDWENATETAKPS
jgi:cytoskeletal protein RodZ